MALSFCPRLLSAALLALLVSHGAINRAAAEQPHNAYPSQQILSEAQNALGETIQYPTTGPARVTAAIVTIPPGGRTLVHRHGVPLFAYILDGEVVVDYGDRGKQTYRKGDGFMEAMAIPHLGINEGSEPVRILAVYMGADGAQNVIPVIPEK